MFSSMEEAQKELIKVLKEDQSYIDKMTMNGKCHFEASLQGDNSLHVTWARIYRTKAMLRLLGITDKAEIKELFDEGGPGVARMMALQY